MVVESAPEKPDKVNPALDFAPSALKRRDWKTNTPIMEDTSPGETRMVVTSWVKNTIRNARFAGRKENTKTLRRSAIKMEKLKLIKKGGKTFVDLGNGTLIEKRKTPSKTKRCPDCGNNLIEGFCTICFRAWK